MGRIRRDGASLSYSCHEVEKDRDRTSEHPVGVIVNGSEYDVRLVCEDELHERNSIEGAVRQNGVNQVRCREKEVADKNTEGKHGGQQMGREVHDAEKQTGQHDSKHAGHVPGEYALNNPAKYNFFGDRGGDAESEESGDENQDGDIPPDNEDASEDETTPSD